MARPAGRPGWLQRRGPVRAAAVAPAGSGSSSPGSRPLRPGLWPGPGCGSAAFPACSGRPLAPASGGQPANRSRRAVTSARLSPAPANLASFIWSSRSPASAESRPARPDPAAGHAGSTGRERSAAAQRHVRVIRRLDAAASPHTFASTTSSRSRTGPMSMITGARLRAGISQLQRRLLPAGRGHDPLGQPVAHAGEDAGQPAAWSCRPGLKPAPRSAACTAPAAAWTPCSWPVNKPASWVGREMTPRASALPPPSANPCSPAAARRARRAAGAGH